MCYQKGKVSQLFVKHTCKVLDIQGGEGIKGGFGKNYSYHRQGPNEEIASYPNVNYGTEHTLNVIIVYRIALGSE